REGTVVARACHPACLHVCHNAMLVRIVTKGVGDDARHRHWFVCQSLCLWTGSIKMIISTFETLPTQRPRGLSQQPAPTGRCGAGAHPRVATAPAGESWRG